MKRLLFIITIIFSFIASVQSKEIWLDELERALGCRQEYDTKKDRAITRSKQYLSSLKNEEDIFNLNRQLAAEYKKYVADSSLYYLEQNLSLSENSGNPVWLTRTYIDLLHLFTSMGNYEECIALFGKLRERMIPQEMVLDFYSVSEFLYSELEANAQIESNKQYYRERQRAYRDLFYQYSSSDDERVLKLKEWELVHQGEPEKALLLNNQRCQMVTVDHPEYGCVYFDRAMIERALGNTSQVKFNLALSAINDLTNSTKDNASLIILAQILLEERDLERAFLFGKAAEEDARFFSGLKRRIQVAGIMPDIERSFREKLSLQQRYLIAALLVIALLSFLCAFDLYLLKKRKNKILLAHEQLKELHITQSELNKHLQQINHELESVNHIKEEYIGRYLSLYSFYIDKLSQHRREVIKGISSGSIPALLKRIKSSEQEEEDVNDFYHLFDQSIMAIFPDFVEEFNLLMDEEYKYKPRKDEILNVELRIFALIRLGISDSAQIARLLRYSVNTIYNYRAKVKTRAKVPREEFEQYILQIGSVKVE